MEHLARGEQTSGFTTLGRAERSRLRANLQDEVDGAVIYDALAKGEKDEQIKGVYRRLADMERAHGAFWRNKLARAGKAPLPHPSLRARLLGWLGRNFGPALVLPSLAADEARGSTNYDRQPDAVAEGFHRDERSHARVVQAASSQPGGLAGESLARLEGRHRTGGGNALRAAVLGANDGLVSNLSLVMGVAGASVNSRTLLLTGLAGLVAGACSMAMGEWLSVNSSRELQQRQIEAEAQELDAAPEEEKQELVLIYQSKGLEESAARAVVDRLFTSRDAALDALVREELGVDPADLGGSPWAAASSSFCLFALGAIFPVAPYLFTGGVTAVTASVALSGLALIAIGAATSLFTGRSMAFSAARQLLIGYAAAALTFGVGKLIGVSVH